MLTSRLYTVSELAVKYDRADYTTNSRIDCGLSCPTCSHCLYGSDADSDSDCFCTLSPRANS